MDGLLIFFLLVGIKSVKGCSRDIFLKEDNLILSSPGFEEGKNYDINLHCKWNIQSNSVITVNFTIFNLEYQYKCNWDYVMVYDGICREVTSTKFCGTKAPPTFKGEISICIEFKSDHMVTNQGFQVLIKKLQDTNQQQSTDYNRLESSSIEQFITENNLNSMSLSTDGELHTGLRKVYHSSAEMSPLLDMDNPQGSTAVEQYQYYTKFLSLDEIDNYSPSGMLISAPESQNVFHASFLKSEMNEIKVSNTLHYQHSQIQPTQSQGIVATESSNILQTHVTSIVPTQQSNIFATLHSSFLPTQLLRIIPTQSSYILSTPSSNMQLTLTQSLISLATRPSSIMPSQSLNIPLSQSSSILSSKSSSILSPQSSSVLSTVGVMDSAFSSHSFIYTSTKWETSLPNMSLSGTLLTDIYYGFSDVSQTPGTIIDVDTLNDDKKIKQIPNQKKPLLTTVNTLSPDTSFTLDYFISKMHNPTQVRSTSSYRLASSIEEISDTYETDFDSSGKFYETETPHIYSFSTSLATNTFKGISEMSTYGSISDMHVTSSGSFLPKSSIAYDAPSTEVPSTYDLPVACFMTEQVLINGTGSLVVDMKPSTGQLECSWLLLGHFDETIEVNITNFNIYTGVDCDTEGLVINDGLSAKDGVLFKLCKHTSHINLLSSGPALFVEVMARGHINLTLEYDPKPKGLDCPARLSKCGDRNCLPSEWWCDNEVDCYHGEDEQSCGSCGKDEFRCGNGQCIKDILQCNGRYECDDASDENYCVMLEDQVLRIRHGRFWLPVCADKWEDTVGDLICKYLSYDNLSGSQTVPSIHTVYMSRKQGQQDDNHFHSYLHPSTICHSKTEITLNCSKKDCGERSQSLMIPYIIGGTQAYKGQWPWVVAVRKGNNFICGGTLISNRWVITAGHCVESVLSVPHMVSIVTGTPMKDGIDGRVIRVSEIIINPDYNFIYKADIAVLLLQMPVSFDDYIKPICLPNTLQHLPRDSLCYTAGWGLTDPKDSKLQKLPNDLMYAKAFIWTNSKCSSAYSSKINDSMICAGILAGKGGDTCQGDSGGPLMCQNNHGTWQVVGVTSWGGGICGKSTLPGVYTRVTKYDTWIKSVTAIRDYYLDTKCNFEKPGICSLEDISTGSFMWTKRKAGWSSGGQPLTDSTTRTSEGHYLYADTYMVQANQSNKAVLKYRFKDIGGDRCLTFSYKFFNHNCLKLSVVDFRSGSFQHELWELSYISGDWTEAAIAIASPVIEIHVIASRVFSHSDGGVAIDDIEVLNRTCKDTNVFNCHFNNGDTCGYTNSKTDIGYWEMHQSIELPKTEWCLRFNGDNFPPGTKARLTSSILQSTGPRCFSFVYKLCYQNANYLSVLVGYVFNGLKFYGSSLWTRSVGNMDCSVWSKGHVDIPSVALDHFIAIQVERGHQSDSVYIDDIMVQSGNCFK